MDEPTAEEFVIRESSGLDEAEGGGEEAAPPDAIRLLIYARKQILREGSPIRNGSYYNIDQGIEPDVVLTRVETFYNRERLTEIIHSLD